MKDNGLATRIVLGLNWLFGVIFFHLLNWTRVYFRYKIPKETGILFVASHFTMVDSWLIGTCFNLFDILFKTKIIPYNVPEKKNFYRLWPINWWLNHSKCIPIVRKSGGHKAHQKIIEIISSRSSNVLIFPESTRRRKNLPIKISDSIGKLIVDCQPKMIIPIKLMGLPYKGSFLPVLFRRPKIIIGEPLIIEGLSLANCRTNYHSIAEQVIKGIEGLKSPNKCPK